MAKNKKTNDKCWTKSALKQRGWTDASIRDFLGEPDKLAQNPHYRKAAPMHLYRQSRVKRIEKTKEFNEWKVKSYSRKKSYEKATITKKEKLLQEVKSWEIIIPKKSIGTIRKNAITEYNDWQDYKEIWYNNYQSNSMASEDSDDAFLSRIMVNYIRHDLSSYEERLDMLFGWVGKREAYRILLKKIYKAIKKAYPSLADECNRQLSRKL